MLKIEKISSEIKVSEVRESEFKTQIIVEPLYRGYGNTVANALRRVLLSSIPGTAIKGMRIDGVFNEFSTMEGVKEAVTDVILNVKEIVVKAETPGERIMKLSLKGPCDVKASDIQCPSDIEIINPEHIILTLTTDRTIDMEFLVDTGEGFVVSDEIDKSGWEMHYLAVDAIYTPIRKVSYQVKDTMVGRITNYDKIIMDVETDGSVRVADAISYAVELIRMHMDPISEIGTKMDNFREKAENAQKEDENAVKPSDKLSLKIEDLDLTVRSYNCLKKAKLETLGDVLALNISELMKIKNFGRKSLDEISEKLEEFNLELKKD
ncbi:MAG: DNA-directed RNA polymerase subunit alpha [Fusobacteria bacterium]|nr:DNA-directed RNA polymerase subunit alpha [Fusobacteriota bacterium]